MSQNATPVSEFDKARAALEYTDPDCDRMTWVRIATALKGEFEDDGFELFDNWSSKGKSYEKAAARDTWKSAKAGRVSIGSLYHEAKKGGFKPWEWQTEGTPIVMDEAQRAAKAAERAAAQAAQDAENALKYAEVAQKARDLFKKGHLLAPAHPYIVRKGLQDHPWIQASSVAPRELHAQDLAKLLGYKPKADGVPLAGRILMIPMIDGHNITTLEFIDEHGRKTALAGGLKKGAWSAPVPMGQHLAANPDTPIVVVEGWATGYSTQHAFLKPGHQMPGAYVVVAGADTNLGNVARALRSQHPSAPIVIGADTGNQDSMEYARKAAASVGGCVMAPEFSDEQSRFLQIHLGKKPTDFNDLFIYYQANALPLDGYLNDLAGAFQRAKFPNPAEFPDIAPVVAASPAPRAIPTPSEAPATTGDRTMEATQEAPAREERKVGAPLFTIEALPKEVKDAAQRIFGNRHTLYAPKENGGPYSGEVHETPGYLIQEVSSRSVIVHDKKALEFASDRLKWMDENQKISGHELAVYYNADKGKVYPFDRARSDLDRAVGSFKKSAGELGLSPEFGAQLDQTFSKSMERIQAMRREGLAKAKESRANAAPSPAPQEKAQEQPQPAKAPRKKR